MKTSFDRSTKDSPSYQGARPDLLGHIKQARKVLDLGCNRGALCRAIIQKFPSASCFGIEYNPTALELAREVLKWSALCNAENIPELNNALEGHAFDLIIAGDILEHLANSEEVVDCLYKHLEPGGRLLISLPNLAFWTIFIHLLRQKWPLHSRGIYDNTHRRCFMRHNLQPLAPDNASFTLLQRNYRLRESRQTRWDQYVTPLIHCIPWLREFFTFQYIFAIEKPTNGTL